MSVKAIKQYLLSELDNTEIKIKDLEKVSHDNSLKIDETNYFINELTGKSSGNISSTYASEKQKNERLINEKKKLSEYTDIKNSIDKNISELNEHKKNLQKFISELDKLSQEQKSNSDDRNSIRIDNIKKELESEFISMDSSFENYSRIDVNRLIVDYKLFRKNVDDILKKM